jgi:hypothetical protein
LDSNYFDPVLDPIRLERLFLEIIQQAHTVASSVSSGERSVDPAVPWVPA